jgi:hypothetical protein
MTMQLAMLWFAARVVPSSQRAEWLAEWNAELWYVRKAGSRQATGFCLGAFQDAVAVRCCSPANPRTVWRLETPMQCLGFLGLLATASTLLALRLPEARGVILPFPYRGVERLVMVSPTGQNDLRLPTVALGQYRNLANRLPPQFAGVAFYRPMRVRAAGAELSLALATGNLFDLLGIPVPRDRQQPALVLSDTAWRKLFGGDSQLAGRVVEVASRRSVITAVIPADSWQLPGRIDAWLIDDKAVTELPNPSKGFVLGRLIQTQRDRPSRFSVPNDGGDYDRFDSGSLHSYPIFALPVVALIAMLVAAATVSLRFGEYSAIHHHRRWLFLAGKIALLLPIVLFGTLILQSMIAVEIRPMAVFGYLIAFRWTLMDQQQRCPECLRLLAHPTRIGQPSQTFLEWYGTESMCVKGHGLLYIPEIPTISFGTHRWLRLDRSWSELFS